ncbi:MAG: SLBB domain-containing protein [Stenomitos rutilans HA7619-LM2]|jgi:polysaccharide export outer membrane protein|nr:SLBB domain-containing protein [Stenomitos rutilans HA7619-LM2]
MYKSISQAITEFLFLALVEVVLGVPAIAQSLVKPNLPLKIEILGAIERPGSYFVAPVTPGVCDQASLRQRYQDNSFERINQCPMLTGAIQIAGGVTPLANVRQILIRRLQANHTSQTINVDLWQFLKVGGLTQAFLLQDGDTVMIPTVTNTAFVQTPQETSTTSATNITVLGDVVHPGNFILPARATSNQAILAAGGLKNLERRENVAIVIHLNANGSTTHQLANINTRLKVEATKPLMVQNGDVVLIASYSGRIWNSTRTILDLFSGLQPIGNISNY